MVEEIEERSGEARIGDGRGLDRRSVFGLAGTAALAGVASTMTACTPGARGDDAEGAPSPTDRARALDADFEWLEADIDALGAALREGRLTAAALTAAYLERIEAIDRDGPTLRSVIETNPDAVAIAEERDRELGRGEDRGPLHGLPILLKDNIATADRMTTTAGSLALEGSIPPEDSGVAARLRRAGAVLLGKANLSEWANIRSTNSSSGWSARGGQCRNPYVLDRNPCGSSSGSGVATSANLCVAAIGTETNGSIVCPSSLNGVVGLKPTVGLVSRSRIVPISHSQDTAGPMTRSVRDAAHLLTALAGTDPTDAATAEASRRAVDYVAAMEAGSSLQGRRLGVMRPGRLDSRVGDLLDVATKVLEEAGATLVEVDFGDSSPMSRASFTVLLCELKSDLAAYLEGLGPQAPVRTLADVIAFNEEHAEREMPWFGQEIFRMAEETGGVDDPDYAEALATARRLAGPEGIDRVMGEHRLDAVVAPTANPAWVTDLVHGDGSSGGSSSFAAIAGYPNVTVPMGAVHGLPVGVSFFGRAWSEGVLLGIAAGFEERTHHRLPPTYRPRIDAS